MLKALLAKFWIKSRERLEQEPQKKHIYLFYGFLLNSVIFQLSGTRK